MYYNDKPQAKNIHHLHELERVSKPVKEMSCRTKTKIRIHTPSNEKQDTRRIPT